MTNASYWIKKLDLKPHPEGGHFKKIYQSATEINTPNKRPLFTSIYYMLQANEKSLFHKIESDEIWYFHTGSIFELHMISRQGEHIVKELGNKTENCYLQYKVCAGTIFGGQVKDINSYSLLSCMVSPGFDYNDFALFNSHDLIKLFPEHTKLIKQFTA